MERRRRAGPMAPQQQGALAQLDSSLPMPLPGQPYFSSFHRHRSLRLNDDSTCMYTTFPHSLDSIRSESSGVPLSSHHRIPASADALRPRLLQLFGFETATSTFATSAPFASYPVHITQEPLLRPFFPFRGFDIHRRSSLHPKSGLRAFILYRQYSMYTITLSPAERIVLCM